MFATITGTLFARNRPCRAIALILRDEILSKHSLSHSDRISLSQATALLLTMQHLYKDTCESGDSSGNIVTNSNTIDLALPILSTVQFIDCKEESIQKILSLLEDNSHSFPKLLNIEGIIPNVARCILKRRTIKKASIRRTFSSLHPALPLVFR